MRLDASGTDVPAGDRGGARPPTPRPFPAITAAAFAVTAAATAAQFADPRVLEWLRRSPDALARGEWWRVLSPLLVHSDGAPQIAANALGLALLGPAIEWRFGRLGWLVLYLGAGLAGEAGGYAWDPYGAGASVGICGLLGGVAILLLRHPLWRARAGGVLLIAGGVGLTAAHDNHGPALLAGAALAWQAAGNGTVAADTGNSHRNGG